VNYLRSDPEKGGVGPWIVPDEEFDEVAHQLRYNPQPLRSEMGIGASVMGYYRHLIEWPRWRREQAVREIRQAMKKSAHAEKGEKAKG
jgi:hypothetical protein